MTKFSCLVTDFASRRTLGYATLGSNVIPKQKACILVKKQNDDVGRIIVRVNNYKDSIVLLIY